MIVGEAGRVLSPPDFVSPGPVSGSDATALFVAARRRRRRRRTAAAVLAAALGGSVLGGLAAWPHHAAPRSASRSGGGASPAGRAAGFTLPGALVAWVDYDGGLHLGDVATQAQRVVATIPDAAGAGPGWLVVAGGRLYVGGSAVVREVDLTAGTVRRVHSGTGVFASADGRQVYLVQADGTLVGLPVGGPGRPRALRAPAGWSFDPGRAVAGGILVASRPRHVPPLLGVWSPGTGRVRIIARGFGRVVAAGPTAGARSSMVAWAPARCAAGSDCPVEITDAATLATVSVRSPLHYGFAGPGAAFSPDGASLAAWVRATNLVCCANTSELAIINARTGTVHLVPAARLVTPEDAGWILWLPGGRRLLAGALSYSYAVDTASYAARPFFFFPQTADGPAADHDIMDTPDINFSAVLVAPPARPGARPGGAS